MADQATPHPDSADEAVFWMLLFSDDVDVEALVVDVLNKRNDLF